MRPLSVDVPSSTAFAPCFLHGASGGGEPSISEPVISQYFALRTVVGTRFRSLHFTAAYRRRVKKKGSGRLYIKGSHA